MPTATQRIATRKIRGTVPANSFADFDTQPFTSFSSTKYILEVSKPDETAFFVAELIGAKMFEDVDDQIYSKFPGALDIACKVFKNGTDVSLRITNNENFLVNVSILKSKT